MAYCTVDDVQAYLTYFTLDSTSQPTKTEVSQMCKHVSDGVIDPQIRKYIDLPLTDRVGLEYLRIGAIYYVLANVYKASNVYPELYADYNERFRNFMLTIEENNTVLIKPNNNMPKAQGSTRRTAKYTTDFDEDIW